MSLNISILPYGIGIDAGVIPGFATAVTQSEGGASARKNLRDSVIRNYDFSIGPDDAQEVYNIHAAVRGRRWPIVFRDWGFNYSYTNEPLAFTTVSGGTTAPLIRTLTPSTGNRTYTQRILVPVDSVVGVGSQFNFPTTVKVNGSPTSSFHIQDPGIIVMNSALGGGDVLTASGQYFIPGCFMDDHLALTPHVSQSTGSVLVSIQSLRVEEILEAEFTELMGL